MDNIDLNSEAVVLVGGGFAGLATAFALSKTRNPPKIILIEPKDRFIFLPLLYELLSGEINVWEVAPSYQSLVEGKGIVLIQDYVVEIDTNQKQVQISSGSQINYSKLVIATGSKPNDYGIPGVDKYSLRFQDLIDVELLGQLIKHCKKSSQIPCNLVIVGAGFAGVELTCKVADLLGNTTQIHLIERAAKVLPQGKSFNQEQIEKALSLRDIKVHLCTEVIEITADRVILNDLNEPEFTKLELSHHGLIWLAGTKAALPELIPKPHLLNQKLKIDSNLKAIGYQDVYAIGDVSFHEDIFYPATAQVAMQQGEFVARNLMFSNKAVKAKPFQFNDLGEMLSLGIGKASITALGLTISGSMAFQIRRMIYLTKMPKVSLGLRSMGAWLLRNVEKC
tara:strand:- start:2408 stop:3589 length:1182 start_codon:yes stop_codon:yes gene_type:complete